jgi:hypothetical protein
MDEGKITAAGSYGEILSKEPKISSGVQHPTAEPPLAMAEKSNSHLTVVEDKDSLNTFVEIANDEKTILVGHPQNWSVYTYYFRSAGYGLLVSFLVFIIIEAFCTSFQSQFCLVLID